MVNDFRLRFAIGRISANYFQNASVQDDVMTAQWVVYYLLVITRFQYFQFKVADVVVIQDAHIMYCVNKAIRSDVGEFLSYKFQ